MNSEDAPTSFSLANSIPLEVWRLKASTASVLTCAVCGENTRWGRNTRGVRLCEHHWSLMNRLRVFARRPLPTGYRDEQSGDDARTMRS